MCGICGIIHDDPSRPVDIEILKVMNRTMTRRGPDDEGYFLGRGSGLGIRRLSIIDVAGGHQPFSSERGDIHTICNGEIYNFKEIRGELEAKGHTFRTRSDVEILPHLYEEYGVDFLDRLNGMFGLGLWDETHRCLILARDRMGEKPVYWTHQRGMFVFGSELKAILAHPEVRPSIDRLSLSKYLAYEYIPAPNTIFDGIQKIEPGHLVVLKDGVVSVRKYWDIPIGKEMKTITEEDATAQLLHLIKLSVRRRLMSDVPLGAFLSGGIDSSTVVAMMSQIIDPKKIRTFSIAFEEASFDESSHARKVARHFGTDHRERLCRPLNLLNLLPQVVSFLDEPLGDASIIPTFALSKFTREYVTVALSGDGGDELFAGYQTFGAERLMQIYHLLPNFIRQRIIEPLVRRLPSQDKDLSLDFKSKQFIKAAHEDWPVRHIVWVGSFSPAEQERLLAHDLPEGIFEDALLHAKAVDADSSGNRLLYLYKKLYLAEDVLTKVDRASMAASLESRAPFLDHELVEFVTCLPYRFKMRGMTTKYILKKAVGPLLPKGVASRSKKGFSIPVAKWLKGPLKEMMLDILDKERIRREGFFRPEEVQYLVNNHLSGRFDNRKKLWTLMMFEMWLEKWLNNP